MARRKQKKLEVRVEPRDGNDYGLALFESAQDKNPMVRFWGVPFRAVSGQVLDALKKSGYRPTDLRRTRKAPFILPEHQGVRLGLLMLSVKPLRKLRRIETISDQIKDMSDEEAYYWFSKCTAEDHARRAQKALRILLAKE